MNKNAFNPRFLVLLLLLVMYNQLNSEHQGIHMNSINYKFSQDSIFPSPVDDIAMSNSKGTFYSVAKYDDDGDNILAFFHSTLQAATHSRYGRFFVVYKDGTVYQQPLDELEPQITTLRQAFDHISINPQVAFDFYLPALLAYGKKFVGEQFTLEEGEFYNDSAPLDLDIMYVLHNVSNPYLCSGEENDDDLKLPDNCAIVEYDTKVGLFMTADILLEEDLLMLEQMKSDARDLTLEIGHKRFYQEDKLPFMTLGMNFDDIDEGKAVLQCFFPLCDSMYWEYKEGEFFNSSNHDYIINAAKRLEEVLPEIKNTVTDAYM